MVLNAKRLFEITPFSEEEKKIHGDIDYASSITDVKNSVNELNELIPDRNADMTEVRFAVLQRSVQDLGRFLQARGLNVEIYHSPADVKKLVDAASQALSDPTDEVASTQADSGDVKSETTSEEPTAVAVAGWPFPTDSETGENEEGDVIKTEITDEQ